MQTALYALTLLAATFLWGYFFYKKDYHPQPLRVVAQIFAIGLFSMAPVFGYKAIYLRALPRLAEHAIFQPLLSNPLLVGLTYFVLNLALLCALLFTLSSLVALCGTIFKTETMRNIRRALKEEPLDFMTVSVMIGLLIYLETVAQAVFDIPLLRTALGSILFLGIIEEYVKHLIVRMVDDKKLKDIDDAITLSVIVGLAFALIETVIYAVTIGDFSIIIYRSFLSIPIHLVASGIFGYYYGMAHFSKDITRVDGGEKILFPGWLPKMLKCKRSLLYAEGHITQGLFFATLFHAAANVLFEIEMAWAVVPFVVIGLVTLVHLYKESHAEWRLIQRHS